MPAELTKTSTVLVGGPLYESPDLEGRDTSVQLDREVWNEMGQPDTITVTIEPGDRLND